MQIIDQLLSKDCPFNVLVAVGPIGCGKSYKIRKALEHIPDTRVEYIYPESTKELKKTYVSTSFFKTTIVRVIDPADMMKRKSEKSKKDKTKDEDDEDENRNVILPKDLLNFDSKYIIVANSLENLPEWCRSGKVLHTEFLPPTPEELLEYAKKLDPKVEFVPPNITDYYSVEFWVKMRVANDSTSVHRGGRELSFPDLITLIREGQNPPIPSLSPYELEILMNKSVGYREGAEIVSLLDVYSKCSVSKRIMYDIIIKLVRDIPKLLNYFPNVKKKKIPEAEPEFIIGEIKKEEKKPEKTSKSLFDF